MMSKPWKWKFMRKNLKLLVASFDVWLNGEIFFREEYNIV